MPRAPTVGMPGLDHSSRVIPYAVLMLSETAWEVIDRMCKLSGLLAFEQADGSLLLAEGHRRPRTRRWCWMWLEPGSKGVNVGGRVKLAGR